MQCTTTHDDNMTTLDNMAIKTTDPSCDRNEDCKNGGVCKFDTERGDSFCECDDRHLGPVCATSCPLQCDNGGVCRLKDGQEHADGPDTNVDHYECKCQGSFTGAHCEFPFLPCPDGSMCLNGGECTKKIEDSAVYRCICPYGLSGEQCEGSGEIRTYTKGPVTRSPEKRRFVAEIVVVASLAILVAMVFFIRIQKRQYRKELLENDDGLDDLMMIGRYSDSATDEEDDDDKAGIETTFVL